jgi:hypothetical protein
MWLLVQGWLLRNVLTLMGWLAAAAAVAAVLFGARQAGRTAERIENMRRTRPPFLDLFMQRILCSAAPLAKGTCATRKHEPVKHVS